ncbi:LOW QUALITY PROTEIN: uncharacterized protein V3H86_010210 [Mergus octosetaceus]
MSLGHQVQGLLPVPVSQLPSSSISVTLCDGAILGHNHGRCQCHRAVMLLYTSGNISVQQRAQLAVNVAMFTIIQVSQEDGGAFACGNKSDPSSLHPVHLALGDAVLIMLGLVVTEAMQGHRHTPGQLPPPQGRDATHEIRFTKSPSGPKQA